MATAKQTNLSHTGLLLLQVQEEKQSFRADLGTSAAVNVLRKDMLISAVVLRIGVVEVTNVTIEEPILIKWNLFALSPTFGLTNVESNAIGN